MLEAPSGDRVRVWRHPAVRVVAWLCGIALIGAAIWMIARDSSVSQSNFEKVREGFQRLSATQCVALLLLPVASLFLTTACFWQLMRGHGRVGFPEMWHLIASSWVLNLLPLKPGLIGRVVYHTRVNQIPATTSVRVLIEASAAGVVGVALLSGLLIREKVGALWFDGLIAAAWLALLGLGIWGFLRPNKIAPRFASATLLRSLDAFTWVLRYGLLFRLIDVDLPLSSAAVIAAGAQAASYVPLVGNGLGVREWVVGALSRRVSPGAMGLSAGMAAGLTADLCNRLIELIILGPIGLLGVWWVARRVRHARSGDAATMDQSGS